MQSADGSQLKLLPYDPSGTIAREFAPIPGPQTQENLQ